MVPTRINNDQASGRLNLHWPDGNRQQLDHAFLRSACPCAFCRAAQLNEDAVVKDDAIRITELNPFGYGVQIVFSDGHDRGIFPWVYLAGLGEAKRA